MRVIVAGSRSITSKQVVETAIEASGFDVTELISGHARGVDKLAEQTARERAIPVRVFRAEWDKIGRRAGIFRNVEMARHADALVAIWDGKSKGTSHMIEHAQRVGLLVHVHRIGS